MTEKFPCMLASPQKEIHRIEFPCVGQTKMDGMRAMIVCDNDCITVFSRNGNKMIKLDVHFKPMCVHREGVYDGELTVLDDKGVLMDRKSGNGILHKAVESVGTISDEEVARVRITLWDFIGLDEFKAGIDTKPYHERIRELESMPEHHLFEVVPTYDLDAIEHAELLFRQMLDSGEEGIILKNKNHPWEAKRSKQIVKMKEVIENDYKIVGFVEGEGKASGMCGAIMIENKDGTIKSKVGTGMDDDTRVSLWKKRKTLIDTIVTVRHNGLISSRDRNSKALFLPRFIELRPDKGESD